MNSKGITVVLTSCGRPDLLERTIASFDKFNTYPVDRKIIVEDGGIDVMPGDRPDGWSVYTVHDKGERVGQITAIDIAYSFVKTPYIFHLEDDWEFYAPGFIEKSLEVLENEPKCVTVWLRHPADTNGHPIVMYGANKYSTLKLSTNYKWRGFTFNPGLRRLCDYERIAPFHKKVKWDRAKPWQAEQNIGELYYRLGYYAVIFRGGGYVRHIGNGRHVI